MARGSAPSVQCKRGRTGGGGIAGAAVTTSAEGVGRSPPPSLATWDTSRAAAPASAPRGGGSSGHPVRSQRPPVAGKTHPTSEHFIASGPHVSDASGSGRWCHLDPVGAPVERLPEPVRAVGRKGVRWIGRREALEVARARLDVSERVHGDRRGHAEPAQRAVATDEPAVMFEGGDDLVEERGRAAGRIEAGHAELLACLHRALRRKRRDPAVFVRNPHDGRGLQEFARGPGGGGFAVASTAGCASYCVQLPPDRRAHASEPRGAPSQPALTTSTPAT